MSQISTDSIKPKSNSKVLGVLFLAVFVDLLGFGLVLPFFPFWIVDIIGESEIMLGILFASFSAMQFIFAPFWGRLSDRIGRRPVILIGLTGTIIGFTILTISALFFIESLALLFLSRIVAGIGTAATLPTSLAYISDSTTGKDRVRGFGLIGAAFGIGFAVGPAIGAVFNVIGEILYPITVGLTTVGYWAPALFATVLAVVNLLTAINNLPETYPSEKREAARIHREKQENVSTLSIIRNEGNLPAIIILITLNSFVVLGFASFESTIILYGQHQFQLTDTIAGIVLTVLGSVGIIVQVVLIKPLSQRFSDAILIAIGIFFAMVGFLGLSTIINLEGMLFWVIFIAFGIFIMFPTSGALLSKQAPQEIQGTILGLSSGARALMSIIGPILGTYLFAVDVALPYQIAAILLAIGFLLVFVLLRIINKNSIIDKPK